MPLYTSSEIKAKIETLDARIAKAEDSQIYTSGGPGAGMHTQRGDLRAMYAERERLEKLFARVAAEEQGSAVAQGVQYRRAE